LWKNPRNLTDDQHAKLAWIAKTDPRLHRAHLLKEGLREVFLRKGEAGKEALDRRICGPGAAASPRSSRWPGASSNTGPRSRRPSTTICPTG